MGQRNNLVGAAKVFNSLVESLDGLRDQLTLVMQAPRGGGARQREIGTSLGKAIIR